MIRTVRHHVSLVFLVLCLSLTVAGLSRPASKGTAGEIAGKPQTPAKQAAKLAIDQAVMIAASDLGLQSFRKSDVTVEQSIFADESIPFLRRKIMGQPVYRVVFHNVTLSQGQQGQPVRQDTDCVRIAQQRSPLEGDFTLANWLPADCRPVGLCRRRTPAWKE